ncbi:glycosyltransferase family 2 protein [Campylobacter sp. faydin G-24]|uniref:Glycosyltransferase family 2 protein n=1 Tax=Campylobacter anatolicus TaxID=2829105 RepID=A0ABS5HI64_9BACT|nr:glycosyltransferase family A protein [Campylobacter anatolicus]MBR8463715.1 glycosyltransferase family 2 protein [Campylobacter anatolicus]
MSYKISVIVPIYNVEKYIKRCAVSLFEQNFDSIEYIFIDDCSQDNSINNLKNVIELYPNRKNDIKIFYNLHNQGVNKTRNVGFNNASGKYCICIDSDDWCELDMLSSLYSEAILNDSDLVISDMFIEYAHRRFYEKNICKNFNDKTEVLKSMLNRDIILSLSSKLVRTDIYKTCVVPDFGFGEDNFYSIQIAIKSNKISYLNRAFVHYDQTTPTSTGDKNKRFANILKFYQATNLLLKQNNIADDVYGYYYAGILHQILIFSRGDINPFIRENFKEALNIKYVFLYFKSSILFKMVYILPFIRLGRVFGWILDITRFLRGINDNRK